MLKFSKANAYGNDFLYVLADAVTGASIPSLAREMCERHLGVGADGLIVYHPVHGGARMRIFNADGSRAEISGNGVRALAAVLLAGDLRPGGEVTIQTEAGPKRLERVGREKTRQTFRAAMGKPRRVQQVSITAAGESVQPVVLDIGNPQCVVLGPLPSEERFRRLGAALERHEMFLEGTNVEFADVETPDRIRILIWERGVGPTLSSGTGSCASLVAAASFRDAARQADVVAPGGVQRVEWLEDGVYLTGWAELVCEGEWLGDIPS
jgi:diaminopimelate epimerase